MVTEDGKVDPFLCLPSLDTVAHKRMQTNFLVLDVSQHALPVPLDSPVDKVV